MQQLSKLLHIAYPIFEPPPFAEIVEAFIRERARRDLPNEQFKGRLDDYNPRHYREFWGMLNYMDSGQLVELGYSHPNQCKLIRREGRIIGAEGGHSYFVMDNFERMEHLVDYHSHPKGNAEGFIHSDRQHVSSIAQVVERLVDIGAPVKDLHFALYLPHEDKVHWFKQEI